MELIFYTAPLCPDEKLAGLLALAEGVSPQPMRKTTKKGLKQSSGAHFVLKCKDRTYSFADTAENRKQLGAAGIGHTVCVTVTALPNETGLHVKEIKVVN